MTHQHLIVETKGRVGVIRLNRPQALNALNTELMSELAAAIGLQRTSYADSKREHDKTLIGMHDFFEQARHYQKAKASKEPSLKIDLRFEAMIPVLEGKMPVMMMVPTPPSPAIASIGVARPVVLAVGIGVELRAIAGVGNNRRCSRYGRSG